MKKDLICLSIIIPVYNVEKYLETCLTSLINQTIRDLEIICIDDGSTDNSLKILSDFAQKDSRIKVYTQENSKQGTARNNGIKAAQGEYIGFVDPDDYVDIDFFEKLYYAAKKSESDIASASIIKHKKNYTKYILKYNQTKTAKNISDKIKLCSDRTNRFFNSVNKIYRTSFVKNNNIFFPEQRLHEDVEFAVKAIYYANQIISVPNTLYHYVQRPDSTCNSKELKEQREEDRIFVYKEMQKFAFEHSFQLPERMNYYKKVNLNWLLKAYVGIYKTKYLLFGILTIPTILLKLAKFIFSIKNSAEIRLNFCIFGIKLSIAKPNVWLRRENTPYQKYKKENLNITKLPRAQGQIRDIQCANLELLKELDYICKENNLKYWLDFGTLIGAARHKGYIPWDDDIDTSMLRCDYEKVFEAFQKSSRNPDIYPAYHRNNKKGSHYFIKIKHKKCPHLFVDIFPCDIYRQKLSEKEQIEQTKNIRTKRYLIESRCQHEIIENDVLQFLLQNLQKEIIKPNGIEHSDIVWGVDFRHTWNNWFAQYDTIFPLKTIEFEGLHFPSVNNIDTHLKRIYGNYMQYPKKIGFGHSMYVKLNQTEKDCIALMIKAGNNE